MNKEKYITKEVTVSLSEVIDLDLEGFLDLLSERAVGHECLMDITYKTLRVDEEGDLVIEVTGDNSYSSDDVEILIRK